LEHLDPEEAYRVDLIRDARPNTIDREMALSYVRNAQFFEHAVPEQVTQHFPIILEAVNFLDNPPGTALSTLTRLLNRHGNAVMSVMRKASEARSPLDFPEQSLPRLFGTLQSSVGLPRVPVASVDDSRGQQRPVTIEIDKTSRLVVIDESVELEKNATVDLLMVLAEEWLSSIGKGFDPMDYPCIQAGELAKKLGVESDEAVRRRVQTARRTLAKKIGSAGLAVHRQDELIENFPWNGYRLAPDRVIVRLRSKK
jgi:hypothetical protein